MKHFVISIFLIMVISIGVSLTACTSKPQYYYTIIQYSNDGKVLNEAETYQLQYSNNVYVFVNKETNERTSYSGTVKWVKHKL